MSKLLYPLLLLVARATESELAQYVEFLKAENRILRSKLPKRIRVEAWERERQKRKIRRVWHSLLPVLTFSLLILGWWAFVEFADVPEYIMPAPLDVFPRLIEDFDRLVEESMVTMQEIFLGYFLAVALAIPLGLLLAMNDTAKRALYPAVVFIQLIP